ncbi:MAG: SDR family oxidoreductase [Myxococcota bacterium]
MKLSIFGGTGGVGSQLIPLALDAGHDVTAFARNPTNLPRRDELSVVEGQLDDAAAVAQAIEGAHAVLSTLGARSNTPDQVEVFGTAMQHITSAMKEHEVQRLISISGAGVLIPEDHVTMGRRFVGLLLKLFAKHVTAAKKREYEIITATDLDWVLVRPPRILPGAATGTYRVLGDRVPSPKITQGDVAHFMLKCASGDEWVRRAPIPGY